ncbi:uncharacterized protein LOC144444207 [Glandiceps talaboti]
MDKQALRVFTKLESFKKAGDEVLKLLKDIVDEQKVEVSVRHADTESMVQSQERFVTETEVVVIDARQTRSLVTPERRDRNVDHWNELQWLYDKAKPQGSILVLIYGDKDSKKLEAGQLLSKTWKTTWKFNDVIAFEQAQKGLCLSIWDKFSKAQIDFIKSYLREILFIAPITRPVNTLAVGDRDGYSKVIQSLNTHPLLLKGGTKSCGDFTMSLFNPSDFKTHGVNTPKVTVYCDSKSPAIKVCGTDITNYYIQKYVTENISKNLIESDLDSGISCHVCIPSNSHQCVPCTLPIPLQQCNCKTIEFDQLILMCHCSECFNKIYSERQWLTTYIKELMANANITIYGNMVPLVREFRDQLLRENVIKDLQGIGYQDGFPSEERLEKLSKLSDAKALDIYIWYAACQTPIGSVVDFSYSPCNWVPTTWTRRCRNQGNRRYFYICMVIVVVAIIIFVIALVSSNYSDHRQSVSVAPSTPPTIHNGSNFVNAL